MKQEGTEGPFWSLCPFPLCSPRWFWDCAILGWCKRYKNFPPSAFDALLVLALDHLSTFCPVSKASSFDDKVIVAVTCLFQREAFLGYASHSWRQMVLPGMGSPCLRIVYCRNCSQTELWTKRHMFHLPLPCISMTLPGQTWPSLVWPCDYLLPAVAFTCLLSFLLQSPVLFYCSRAISGALKIPPKNILLHLVWAGWGECKRKWSCWWDRESDAGFRHLWG